MKKVSSKFGLTIVLTMFTLGIAFVSSAQAKEITYHEPSAFLNRQLNDIASNLKNGIATEEQAFLLAEMTVNAFDAVVMTEYGLKYLKNQQEADQRYHADNRVQGVNQALVAFKKREITFSEFQEKIKQICPEGTERPEAAADTHSEAEKD